MLTIAMHILEAGVSMQTGTIPSERFWASLLEMLPPATRNVSREAGLPMQTGTIPAERFWASFSERLPRVVSDPSADVLPAVYLSPFRRQSSTYVVWEGISNALSGCSHLLVQDLDSPVP